MARRGESIEGLKKILLNKQKNELYNYFKESQEKANQLMTV